MAEKLFDIPKLLYFESKNIFSGSLGKFNYKIFPLKETLKISVWYGLYCLECSEIFDTQEFPLTQEGLLQLVSWLENQHKLLLKSEFEQEPPQA